MARVDVVMPKMGESVMEGTVLTWFKQAGESVDTDEALLEIGTDKVDSEIPSPAAGTLAEILVAEGSTVEVGTVLAVLETEADVQVAESEPTPAPEASTTEIAEAGVRSPEGSDQSSSVDTAAPAVEPAAVSSAPEPAPTVASTIEVVMPKMGESVMEGTVLTWFKQPGDDIETDEMLLEIGTDKVDSEIPSPASGVLHEVFVQEGDTVDVGTVLATIAADSPGVSQPAADISQPAPEPAPAARVAPAPPPSPAPEAAPVPAMSTAGGDGHAIESERRGGDGPFYSPLVRSIAQKEGVSASELATMTGSGRGGRVTKHDILAFLSQRSVPAEVPGTGSQVASPAATPQAQPTTRPAAVPIPPAKETDPTPRVEIIEMDRVRQVIAEHMTRSLATSAHVTSFAEADVTNLVRLRELNKVSFEQREGVRLTYTPFFVKAAVDALREHPLLNSSVEEHRILVKKDFHVGIAVAIDKTGLVVPVIRYAGGMNVTGLAHAAADLANRARNKQLQPDELQGGTFTVTNVGSLGSLMGTPIINQPQVAILATGAITKRPVVKEHPDFGDVIAVRNMVYLSLSYDHRIIDGAMAASFLRNVVSNLEEMGPGYDL